MKVFIVSLVLELNLNELFSELVFCVTSYRSKSGVDKTTLHVSQWITPFRGICERIVFVWKHEVVIHDELLTGFVVNGGQR